MIAAELANMKVGKPTVNSPISANISQGDAAAQLQVGVTAVKDALTVKKHGTPELQEAVRSGEMSVSAAAKTRLRLDMKSGRLLARVATSPKLVGSFTTSETPTH